MIQQEVERHLQQALGASAQHLNSAKLTKVLSACNETNVEGYVLWACETLGSRAFIGSALYQPDTLRRYQKICEQEKVDLIQNIYNAGKLFEGLVGSNVCAEDAFERLHDMVPDYVIYLLMTSSGFKADKFLKAAVDYSRKFPDAVKALPEAFKESVEKIGAAKQQRSVSTPDPEVR